DYYCCSYRSGSSFLF
nr:immunoglobulin light chain junction region [Macaca mulatta]MOW58857.1 immunoglobulin light chain junction region [Macaca mulatta]